MMPGRKMRLGKKRKKLRQMNTTTKRNSRELMKKKAKKPTSTKMKRLVKPMTTNFRSQYLFTRNFMCENNSRNELRVNMVM